VNSTRSTAGAFSPRWFGSGEDVGWLPATDAAVNLVIRERPASPAVFGVGSTATPAILIPRPITRRIMEPVTVAVHTTEGLVAADTAAVLTEAGMVEVLAAAIIDFPTRKFRWPNKSRLLANPSYAFPSPPPLTFPLPRGSVRGVASTTENRMNAKMAAKLILMGSFIVAVADLLQGHDILTTIALLALFLFVVAKVVFAIISRRGGPSQGGGGFTTAWATANI